MLTSAFYSRQNWIRREWTRNKVIIFTLNFTFFHFCTKRKMSPEQQHLLNFLVLRQEGKGPLCPYSESGFGNNNKSSVFHKRQSVGVGTLGMGRVKRKVTITRIVESRNHKSKTSVVRGKSGSKSRVACMDGRWHCWNEHCNRKGLNKFPILVFELCHGEEGIQHSSPFWLLMWIQWPSLTV